MEAKDALLSYMHENKPVPDSVLFSKPVLELLQTDEYISDFMSFSNNVQFVKSIVRVNPVYVFACNLPYLVSYSLDSGDGSLALLYRRLARSYASLSLVDWKRVTRHIPVIDGLLEVLGYETPTWSKLYALLIYNGLEPRFLFRVLRVVKKYRLTAPVPRDITTVTLAEAPMYSYNYTEHSATALALKLADTDDFCKVAALFTCRWEAVKKLLVERLERRVRTVGCTLESDLWVVVLREKLEEVFASLSEEARLALAQLFWLMFDRSFKGEHFDLLLLEGLRRYARR